MTTTVMLNSSFISICMTVKYLALSTMTLLLIDVVIKLLKDICSNNLFLINCLIARITYKALKQTDIMKKYSGHIVISPDDGIMQNNIEITKQKEMLEEALEFVDETIKSLK